MGAAMRWLAWIFFLVTSLVAGIYLLGCWLLGEWPWALWGSRTPEQYDGNEPFEQWAAKMEQGRTIQVREELRNDADRF